MNILTGSYIATPSYLCSDVRTHCGQVCVHICPPQHTLDKVFVVTAYEGLLCSKHHLFPYAIA